MKKYKLALSALLGSFISFSSYAQPSDESGRIFVADTPDAIVCIYNNAQQTRYIYYKTAGVEGDAVRYDGPNNNLLHYALPSGELIMGFNPQPTVADCVYQRISLQDLIKMDRAYKLLTPMPAPGKILDE